MRKVAMVATLAALSFGALQTASAEGFYAGAGLGQSTTEVNLPGPNFKDDDIGFKIFGGYSFNQNFAAEVEYLNGGSAKDGGVKIKMDGFAVSALGSIPLTDAFSLFARLGYGTWDAKASAAGTSAKDSDEELLYGLGAAFNVGQQFQIRLEWEAVDVSGGSFDTIGVNGLVKF